MLLKSKVGEISNWQEFLQVKLPPQDHTAVVPCLPTMQSILRRHRKQERHVGPLTSYDLVNKMAALWTGFHIYCNEQCLAEFLSIWVISSTLPLTVKYFN